MKKGMRTWSKFFLSTPQNVAEHTVRVMRIALTLAKSEEWADLEKVLLWALIHDLWEVRWVDTNYVSSQYVERDEKLAVRDALAWTGFENELFPIREEMEARETLEAQIVRDADTLEVEFELKEMIVEWSALAQDFLDQRSKVYPRKLFTESAKKMYTELFEANPASWHFNAKNRVNQWDLHPDS